MTDINLKKQPAAPGSGEVDRRTADAPEDGIPRDLPYDMMELLFFAYRDFTADADELLTEFGFGRAHHRVLHFVDRNPGIMVTDLLSILGITKQSLGRVLKQLVDLDFIEQQPGPIDRRQRLLYTTPKGHDLATRLMAVQTIRLERAFGEIAPEASTLVRQFLFQMINAETRPDVARLINKKYRPVMPAGRF
ncbi:MarR family winged helix-turn-helix transcriptional regulator [Roseibium litorale]|uniref:Winged helix-turn-helix transcriptional regulator n=1 Tax=Roseibium litorale TaxID=2803841 RepID=A0ABR9CKQ0_9HYPH|nr:MarR family winged helix-turn-helix transcriptional regulator [Roseibium litorale]MBD8891406.1 winged helix-turn-helix transcriptional regulator [Roseibium litorale]